ncbi:MAG TPA: adenylate/guanylate cyclase domain-containing protein [Methylomirabilota bacterium]|nr:adenylate/guanylate cyclase domain-containing protein [Methylomirabilota bacterium]
MRLSLRLKLSLLITALLTTTVLVLSGSFLRTQQQTLTDEMRKRGLTITQNLAAGSKTALLTQDTLGLQLMVRDVARDDDVAYVAVTDAAGKVIAHSRLAELGRRVERPAEAAPLGNEIVVQSLALSGQDTVIDFSAPLVFRHVRVGAVYVGFSQARIALAASHARTRAVVITLAMLAVGVGGAVGLGAALARPIVRLMQGTRAVADGDFSLTLPVTSSDELGALTQAFNTMARSLGEKEMITRAFSRYVTREVVDEILKDPARVVLTGARREVTALFCDIRGFTATAESLPPEEVVELLNAFYELMIETTFKHDGTLDKFLGDGVMAVFGAPLYRADHALMAARTALAMQAGMRELSAQRVAAGKSPLSVGIGLNAGEVIAGTVGTSARMEYTVVGDCVNLASRLQSSARPGQILVSADTYTRLNGSVHGRSLGRLAMKGKDEPIEVWELLGLEPW